MNTSEDWCDLNFLKLQCRRKNMDNKNRHTIKVPDMSCQHCKMRITKSLEQMPDIQSISIDLNTKEVIVETTTAREVIVNRIREEGYNPE
jgi:copper chaperone